MKLVTKRVYDTKNEMDKYLLDNKLIDVNFRYAVIALITDVKGNVLFQRRGDKARDEIGMLADIGGAYEESDISFSNALLREIHEEVGDNADIRIDDFVCGVLKTKFEPKTNKDVNWLFLVYKCTYYGGELLDNEEGKTKSYEFYKMNELPMDDRLDTSVFFWNYYINSYNKCYSYAMGIGSNIKKLDKKKYEFIEDDGDYEVSFDKKISEEWEEFIISNIECGFWNDYIIDDSIRLIFKNNDNSIEKYTLNSDNNQKILEKCRLFAEVKFETVREMYEETVFYKDKLDGIIFYD